jgi:exopolyphosphatase/guanosine-5'-triphosphate,3'-diphosphate pyrophosphatase
MTTGIGVIDCGSNTTRLLIRTSDGRTERFESITGLGRGLTRSGTIDPEAIDRVTEALTDYRSRLDDHGVEEVRPIATAAVRDAIDPDTFLDAAESVIGVRPVVISGAEEARLGFMGATGDLDSATLSLVFDIGGRSTEFAIGEPGVEPEGVVSLSMGSVALTEEFLRHDPPRPSELSQLLSVARLHLDDLDRDLPGVRSAESVIAVGGTATTAAAVEIGLVTYDSSRVHGFVLGRDAAEDVFRTLATESRLDRVHNPGLHPDRADVIVAGCAILCGVIRHLDVDEVVVSEHDLLDGIAAHGLPSP